MIDFAAFLRTRFKPEDWVVAKIDVEGSEYDLFDHLLATGSASLLDEIFVEVRNCRTSPSPSLSLGLSFPCSCPGPRPALAWPPSPCSAFSASDSGSAAVSAVARLAAREDSRAHGGAPA